jgi:toxin ParE1/3/4
VKPAALRPIAEADLTERTRYYLDAGGGELAERFFDTALAALRAIEASPGLGSPRVGELVGINGLRHIGIDGFPCGWIYFERAELIDVIRLLADRQDLAAVLGTTDQD